jgi:hypothetical protein
LISVNPSSGASIYDAAGNAADIQQTDNSIKLHFVNPLISTICFPGHTLVKTDQGSIRFDNVDCSVNTINGYKITNVTRTTNSSKIMVCIPRGCFSPNVPNLDTEITLSHKVMYKGNLVGSGKLVGVVPGIHLIPYDGNPVYNLVLEDEGLMVVHNMICETLSPTNIINDVNFYLSRLCEIEQYRFIYEHNAYMSSIDLCDIELISGFNFVGKSKSNRIKG